MRCSRKLLHTAAVGLSLGAACFVANDGFAAKEKISDEPRTPAETVKSLMVAPGLEATVWAAEPQLVNPTNIDIDARGRVWVVEAANYRSTFKQWGFLRPEGDRILILEDTDGDGKADSQKVFYQDKMLQSPLGICVLGNKVYVAQSPSVLVFDIDESGDKAKGPPSVMFTGFAGIDHDHGVHTGVFGPDGRYYFNSGNEGGKGFIKHGTLGPDGKVTEGEPVRDILGSEIGAGATIYRGKPKEKGQAGYQEGLALACDPDGKNMTTLAWDFRNPYELCVDSFGTVWQSDNDDDGNEGVRIQYLMEGGSFGYKGPRGSEWKRDMPLFSGQTKQQAHWHLLWPGMVPNVLHTGGGSPTGMCVYEGDLLGEKYRGALLHCDAGPNVVHAFMTQPTAAVAVGIMGKPNAYSEGTEPGAGYKVSESIQMLKAEDRWFRPCDICVAPDGAVFVADWYDPGVGGHNMGDATAEKDWHHMRGRIYRVAPTGNKPAPAKLDLNSLDGQIAALKSPNLATRYLGWTKLHEGGAPVVKALEQVFSGDKNPRIRARALWLLARSSDGQKYVGQALHDTDADIRITALRAARLIKMDMVGVANQLVADPSIQIARELCLAMNYEPAEKSLPVLVKLADRYDGKDRWYLEALGIGATAREDEFLAAWQSGHTNKNAEAEKNITWRMKKELPPGASMTPPTETEKKPGKKAPAGATSSTDGGTPGPFVAPAGK